MTLLDAPKFDEVREKHNQKVLFGSIGGFFLLVVLYWMVSGRPIDWPWHWHQHLIGRVTVNRFFNAVEKNDLPTAYGVWVHDADWKQHPQQHATYSFERFERDWSPNGVENEYGTISSHRIAATHIHGNVLMVGIFVNERHAKAINLDYDPHDKTLTYTPDFVQFYEGPGGIQ